MLCKDKEIYMKKALKLSTIAIALFLLCVAIISCGGDDTPEIPTPETGIGLTGMTYDDGVYKTTVDSKTDKFDLNAIMKVESESSVTISNNEDFEEALNGGDLSLVGGNNIFFIRVVDKYDNHATYKVNIYKKQIYTVDFNTNGGTSVKSISVEEGTVISAPSASKPGYTLSWDYEFRKAIYSNTTINAVWTANDYTITIIVGDEELVIDVKHDANYDLTEYIPEKAGYSFAIWSAIYGTGDDEVRVAFDTVGKYSPTENITIVPNFTPQEYSITYVVEDGATNPNTSKSFTVENIPALLNAEWKNDEKRFVGWYKSSDYSEESRVTSLEGIIGNVELWAKFEDVIFTTNVNLVVKDEIIKTETFTYKSTYDLTQPIPEKGFVFDGWYYYNSENGKTKLELSGIWQFKDESIDLVAKFNERINNIEYHLGGATNGNNPNKYNVEMGTVTLESPTFDSDRQHIFLGWFTDPEYKNQITELTVDNVTEEMDIYAKWQYVSMVTFDANGGDCNVDTIKYNFGETVTLPVPQKSGNLFDAWYYNGEKVVSGEWKYKENITLVARFVPTTITINYQLNGGTQNPENPKTFDVFTGIITLLAPTKDEAIFVGWFTDSEFKNAITEIDTAEVREITLYAKWMEQEISISYDSNGGSVSKTNDTLIYGNPYVLPTPEFLGYSFDGWYYGDELVPTTGTWTILSDDVSLVARWTIITYKIEYDLGGVTVEGLVTEYTVNNGDIKLPTLTSDQYLFMGWIDSNGNVAQTFTITSGSTGDRTFKAKWLDKRDGKGFVYEFKGDHMVCVDFVKQVDSSQNTKMPRTYGGYPITGIASKAFSAFGKAFGESEYKNKNYYYTVYIPTTITVIETDAFADCSGMCVMLYLENNSVVEDIKKEKELNALLEWEKTMTYSSGDSNKQVRDCIWGLRPAIGWTRYSAVDIPDVFYEKEKQ